jgi:hypothetical protein
VTDARGQAVASWRLDQGGDWTAARAPDVFGGDRRFQDARAALSTDGTMMIGGCARYRPGNLEAVVWSIDATGIWTEDALPTDGSDACVSALAVVGDVIWAVGYIGDSGAIWNRTNGQWQRRALPGSTELMAIAADAETVWLVGSTGEGQLATWSESIR